MMYTKGREIEKNEFKPKPFTIKCNCCGSTDVTVTAFEYYDLAINCNECGAYLNYGSYRERDYSDEE